ncbi:hypothetical protein QJS10_CPB14g00380 [Acorus calamus]|uniref:Wall-associated receptor kinase C-terminal domain-containing protein n=1 Tax=Acorus calamus TaxID=4465 RepID=A0AAV9DC85_ACOCL|nr:hypothetical protein QJS10_CPB14g00380 [Acorus calamus]
MRLTLITLTRNLASHRHAEVSTSPTPSGSNRVSPPTVESRISNSLAPKITRPTSSPCPATTTTSSKSSTTTDRSFSNTQFFNGSDCAPPRHNLSFSPPFRLNNSDTHLRVYVGCGISSFRVWKQICHGVIAVPDDVEIEGCDYSFIAPIWAPDVDKVVDDYLQILKAGFFLDWDTSMCVDGCVQSGGRCSFNVSTNNAVCLCKDRVHFLECFGDSSGTSLAGTSLVRKSVIGISLCLSLCSH